MVYKVCMKRRTNIYLDDSQIKELRKLSKKTFSSVAEHVRRAVTEYLKNEKITERQKDRFSGFHMG